MIKFIKLGETMKMNVNLAVFEEQFKKMGRENQFTPLGKKTLFEYLERIEEETGTESDLDVVGLCCEWNEYNTYKDLIDDYGYLVDFNEFKEEHPEESEKEINKAYWFKLIDELDSRTTVLRDFIKYADGKIEFCYIVQIFGN